MIKARYPIRIGQSLVAKGTEGQIKKIEDCGVLRATFPGLIQKPDSLYVIIEFPGLQPCICHKSQLEFVTDD